HEVKEGDLLFVIDPRPYDAVLRQADASVLQAQARLKQAEADVKRNEPLARTGATTQADFEKFVADRDVAAAQVESSKAAVVSAKLNVDFCRITAPFGGRISRRFVDPGNLVQADNTIRPSIGT